MPPYQSDLGGAAGHQHGASVMRDALMNVDADTVPMSLKVAATLLAASGAMNSLSAVSPRLPPLVGGWFPRL